MATKWKKIPKIKCDLCEAAAAWKHPTRGLRCEDCSRPEETTAGEPVRCTIDRFGRIWDLPSNELCPTCGQPDSCGDCNHNPLEVREVRKLGGKFACH